MEIQKSVNPCGTREGRPSLGMAAEEPSYNNVTSPGVHFLWAGIRCLVDTECTACLAARPEDLFVWGWEWSVVGRRKGARRERRPLLCIPRARKQLEGRTAAERMGTAVQGRARRRQ